MAPGGFRGCTSCQEKGRTVLLSNSSGARPISGQTRQVPPWRERERCGRSRVAMRGGRQRGASTALRRAVPGLWDVVVTTDYPLVVVVIGGDVGDFSRGIQRCRPLRAARTMLLRAMGGEGFAGGTRASTVATAPGEVR